VAVATVAGISVHGSRFTVLDSRITPARLGIRSRQVADHSLITGIAPACFTFEERERVVIQSDFGDFVVLVIFRLERFRITDV
jgi:hypothetical protein